MSGPYENTRLRPAMQEFLEIEGRERLYQCWDRMFVHTPDTKDAFAVLQDCMNAAANTKPRGAIIVGETDTGKSRTMTAFKDANRPQVDPDHEYAEHPVLYLKAPDQPEPVVFLKKLLDELGYPLRYNAQPADIRSYAVRMLRHCRVGVVMIDEFRDVAKDRTSAKLIDFFVFMKNLINEIERPFVVGGTRSVVDLIASDQQLAGRLDRIVRMGPFPLDKFARILLTFELILPLRKQSNLKDDERIIQRLYTLSGGYIGRLNPILHDACQVAIESGEERIFLSTIDRIEDRSIKTLGSRAA